MGRTLARSGAGAAGSACRAPPNPRLG